MKTITDFDYTKPIKWFGIKVGEKRVIQETSETSIKKTTKVTMFNGAYERELITEEEFLQ